MSRYVDDYCHLSGWHDEKPYLYAHDNSICTLLEIQGMKSIFSPEEAVERFTDQFGTKISKLLESTGHLISVSFESSFNTEHEVEALFGPMRRASRQKSLNVSAIEKELAKLISGKSRYEKCLMACWTLPEAGFKNAIQDDLEVNENIRAELPRTDLAELVNGLKSLEGMHEAFVGLVCDALGDAAVQVRILGPYKNDEDETRRTDIVELRRALLWQETPPDWMPQAPGERTYPGLKEVIDDDMSGFFAPPLAMQLMTSSMKTDPSMRRIEMGGRSYALALMSMFPKTLYPFSELEQGLKKAPELRLPYRITVHLEGGPFKATIKQIAAALVSALPTASTTKNLFHSLKAIDEEVKRGQTVFVKARINAVTWREPHESNEILEQRRSTLYNEMSGWGDPQIKDIPNNPMQAIAETVPGMTVGSGITKPTAVPVASLAGIMPFHRPAPIFKKGETLFTTMAGKIVPHESFSNDQNFWLTLIYATPGSGKSVLLNRMNFDFTCFTPGIKLPYLGIIDVGVSSSGLIEVVREALPEGRKHEASYVRLQNAPDYAINFLDIGLGRREPLAREHEFMSRFLFTLINLKEEPLAEKLCDELIRLAFKTKSDLETSAVPAKFEPGVDEEVEEACQKHAIPLRPGMTWWKIVDALVLKGDFIMAEHAQRYAMPRLDDISGLLSDPRIKRDFGHETGAGEYTEGDLLKHARVSISSASDRYRIFTRPTALDIGDARVMSIDLNDVVFPVTSEAARQNNALMFMIARHLFLKKIAGNTEEIGIMRTAFPSEMRDIYTNYWYARLSDQEENKKRLCYDEYHLTDGTPITKQVEADARQGRKWGLEIVLASQLLKDFKDLSKLASTVFILNADSNDARTEAQQTFDFSDAVKGELVEYVHGPRPGQGANLLARYMLNEEERWIVINNSMGPILLWALTTKKEDRLLRAEMYKRLPVGEALELLARRYPKASAAEYWEKAARTMTGTEDSIAKIMADNLMLYAAGLKNENAA